MRGDKKKPEARGTTLAMVLLREPRLPPTPELLRGMEPAGLGLRDWEGVERRDDALVVDCGAGWLSITLVSAPVPWDQLEGPCETAWYWPQAAAVLRGHRAHAVIALHAAQLSPPRRALLLSRVVAAVASNCDALGVYWGDSTLVHSTVGFAEAMVQATPEALPLVLWVRFAAFPADIGGTSAFTDGMEALGHPELEAEAVVDPESQLMPFLYDLASYMVAGRKPIRDGDTVGGSARHRLTVRRAPSMWDPERSVFKLVVDGVFRRS